MLSGMRRNNKLLMWVVIIAMGIGGLAFILINLGGSSAVAPTTLGTVNGVPVWNSTCWPALSVVGPPTAVEYVSCVPSTAH